MAYGLIILDASAALAMLLAEAEGTEVAELISDTTVINGQIFVPALFWYELGNGLLMAEQTNRITSQASSTAVFSLNQLPIVTRNEMDLPIFNSTMKLAGENGLTFYDAGYLELALRFKAPLKSFDTHLLNLKSLFPLIL
jgi:predicted nucleic acid-binding protein